MNINQKHKSFNHIQPQHPTKKQPHTQSPPQQQHAPRQKLPQKQSQKPTQKQGPPQQQQQQKNSQADNTVNVADTTVDRVKCAVDPMEPTQHEFKLGVDSQWYPEVPHGHTEFSWKDTLKMKCKQENDNKKKKNKKLKAEKNNETEI